MTRAGSGLALLSALAGCGPAPPPSAPPPPPPVAAPPAEPEVPPPIIVDPPPPPPEPAERALPPFPPPKLAVPFPRTAKPGDGAWEPLVPASSSDPALLYRTAVHPDRVKPDVHVALVAIDLTRVALRAVAGTRQPLSSTVPPEHRPGLVPQQDLADLVAVMNGGFMTRHGGWGMMVGGEVIAPPKDDGCTVALLADGSVRIATYAKLGVAPEALTAYRQTPPCLVEQGAVNDALLGGEKPRAWGMSETGGVTIRRSALGVAGGGRTLLYGLGESVTPRQMAEAMRAAGAVSAAELDVNWSYTRFFLYGPGPTPDSPPEVTATLIPKLKHARGEYVKKPAERDFFYLVRRR